MKTIFQKKNSIKVQKIILAIFLYLNKNSVNFQKKIEKNFENNFCNVFIFEK